MPIDMHVHPLVFKEIFSQEEFAYWEKEFGMGLMGPMDWDEIEAEMNHGSIEKSVLLPLDCTTTSGGWFATNDQVAKLVSLHSDRLIGFASVDPHRPDALEELQRAFDELGAKGVKLNPAKQKFMPDDPIMEPIYQLCEERNRPIIFHSGLSWEPNTPGRYCHPLVFESVLINHPELRVCLAHFAWPWVREMVMLMLKYPNVYTDTSVLYLDSPEESMKRLFTVDMGPLWFERSFPHQVMFASNTPRFRAFKFKRALDEIPMRAATREALYRGNALRFMNGKEA